jgi:hypothetical protein
MVVVSRSRVAQSALIVPIGKCETQNPSHRATTNRDRATPPPRPPRANCESTRVRRNRHRDAEAERISRTIALRSANSPECRQLIAEFISSEAPGREYRIQNGQVVHGGPDRYARLVATKHFRGFPRRWPAGTQAPYARERACKPVEAFASAR